MITLSASVPPGQETDAIAKIDEVLKNVQEGNFTEKDIERARRLLRNTYMFGQETNAGKADSLGFYETIDRADFAIHYLEGISKVTKPGLISAAKKYLGRPHYRMIMNAPQKKG